jgi:serine/threonine protein kinase
MYHISQKELQLLHDLINDFNNCPNNLHIIRQFICLYYNSWIDNDDQLYVQQEYCLYGDLLDYLEKLENYNINLLSEAFYWDLIFEMLCVRNLLIYYNI